MVHKTLILLTGSLCVIGRPRYLYTSKRNSVGRSKNLNDVSVVGSMAVFGVPIAVIKTI